MYIKVPNRPKAYIQSGIYLKKREEIRIVCKFKSKCKSHKHLSYSQQNSKKISDVGTETLLQNIFVHFDFEGSNLSQLLQIN